jgi:hypothetical protein
MPHRRQFPCQSVSEPTDGPGPVRQDPWYQPDRTSDRRTEQERTETMAIPGKRDPRNDAPVDDEQDVQGHGLDFDGMDDSGLTETQGPGRIRAMDDPRANQQ